MNRTKLKNKNRGRTWPLSIAPMMQWTDRHYRFFMRQITRHTLLYTEMITSGAVLHGNREKLLGFSAEEKPLALQIGGDNPEELARCAQIVEEWGYDEIDLNIGCPSEKVQKGNFGACLMAEPELVADCVRAMRDACNLPVTVKHRIGIDNLDSYEALANFIQVVSEAGCDSFIVHSRIAILKGLSPKDNRKIPPIRYEDVYRLKKDFPELIIEINGEIKTMAQVSEHLKYVDGVMIGRAAYENPYLLSSADSIFYESDHPVKTRRQIIETMAPYLEGWIKKDVYPNRIIRHMLSLFSHKPGNKRWKRYLSEHAHKPGVGAEILIDAMEGVPEDVLDERVSIAKEDL